jgi:hypothetical protein
MHIYVKLSGFSRPVAFLVSVSEIPISSLGQKNGHPDCFVGGCSPLEPNVNVIFVMLNTKLEKNRKREWFQVSVPDF